MNLAENIIALARQRKIQLGLAESCTGGMIASALTDIPRASTVFGLGLVTYANTAKQQYLSVPEAIIIEYGAVSEAVAAAMVAGLLAANPAIELGLAVTGIAGPDGGSSAKPVGLVYFARQRRGQRAIIEKQIFTGNRADIRAAARDYGLGLLQAELQG